MQSTSLPPSLDDLSDDEREHLLTNVTLRSLADVLPAVSSLRTPAVPSAWFVGPCRPTDAYRLWVHSYS